MMRTVFGAALLVAGCGVDSAASMDLTYQFGPYTLAPGQEITDQCVSVTLHNEQPLYINQVELTAGAGFHHSNWFWVPQNQFAGPDGTWNCSERYYSEAAAGLFGAVVFAQSTQSTHEIQAFPVGAATKIPPHSKLVAGTHLLNPGDAAVTPSLEIKLTQIDQLTTELHGLAFENQSIAIPPHAKSRFTLECDLTKYKSVVDGTIHDRTPSEYNFKIYHALAHYHSLGSGMAFEAIRDSDGTSEMMFDTTTRIGDALGAKIDPPFDVTGHSKLRFSCEFDNPRDATVGWGVGDQEMCIIFAFTDSPDVWSGGVISATDPGPGVNNGGIIDFTHSCDTITADGMH